MTTERPPASDSDKRLILAPLALAFFSVAYLAAENVSENIRLAATVLPFLGATLIGSLCWVAAGGLTRLDSKRSLLAVLGVLFFLFYGFFDSAIRALGAEFSRSHAAVPLWLLVVVAAGTVVVRWPGDLARTATFSATMVLVLAVFPLIKIASSALRGAGPTPVIAAVPIDDALEAAAERPDIYFIVLDKYSRSRDLEEHFGFNNGPFEEALRARGFVVPAESRVQYVHTFLSLASMLNWMYLDEIADEQGPNSADRAPVYRLIEDNRAAAFLRDQGYRFVFFPTSYVATHRNRNADTQIPEPWMPSVRFGAAWVSVSALNPVRDLACTIWSCTPGRAGFVPESTEMVEWKFEQLAQLPDSIGPKLVFAHFLVPHDPYRYNPDCTHRSPFLWPAGEGGPEWEIVREAYVAQIDCVNRLLLGSVDQILAGSETPPVIMIQGDHGQGRISEPIRGAHIPLGNLTPDRVAERSHTFAAYYLPHHESKEPLTIAPINLFPVIFNQYFGTNIALQEAATYWSNWGRPYDFTRID